MPPEIAGVMIAVVAGYFAFRLAALRWIGAYMRLASRRANAIVAGILVTTPILLAVAALALSASLVHLAVALAVVAAMLWLVHAALRPVLDRQVRRPVLQSRREQGELRRHGP